MSAGERVSSSRAQLAAHPYEWSAGEFVRFRIDANDDLVAGIVRSVVAEGNDGSELFRHHLGDEESQTLRLFAMRRILQGRRQSSLGPIYEALDSFALLSTPEDVPWDSWLKAALYVARSIGGDLAMIGRRFSEVAHEDSSARFDVALEAMNRVEALSQCLIMEVTTSHGVGFVEVLVFRDSPTAGLRGAPRLGDNRISYHPSTNLAQLAATFADALDATGLVATSPISQDQLAATSFSLAASGSYLPVNGCLSFVAYGEEGAGSFTVFIAELPEETDVTTLAQAAAGTDDQAAFADFNRLIVLSPQPSFDEHVDLIIDWHDFAELANTSLHDPASR